MRFLTGILALAVAAAADSLPGLPTVPYLATGGSLPPSSLKKIIVHADFATAVDERGQTLIPPTLRSFAETFAADLASALGRDVPVETGAATEEGAVFLTLGDAADFTDAAGRKTSEGYALNVTVDGILISGASPLGAWWGTRTVMQQLALGGEVPLGYGVDSPGWETRGMMVSRDLLFFRGYESS